MKNQRKYQLIILLLSIILVSMLCSCSTSKKSFTYCASYNSSFKIKPNPKIAKYQGNIILKKNRKKSI